MLVPLLMLMSVPVLAQNHSIDSTLCRYDFRVEQDAMMYDYDLQAKIAKYDLLESTFGVLTAVGFFSGFFGYTIYGEHADGEEFKDVLKAFGLGIGASIPFLSVGVVLSIKKNKLISAEESISVSAAGFQTQGGNAFGLSLCLSF